MIKDQDCISNNKSQQMAYPDDLVFYVKYHIKSGCVEEFKDRLLGVVNNMIKEDSFVSAFVHQDAREPTRFSMYERWRESSKEAFMSYQMDAKSYRREYEQRLPLLSEAPRKIHLLRPLAFWANTQLQPANDNLVFYVNFHIKPDLVEEWKEEAIKVLCDMSREKTFVSTFLHQDAEDPSRFSLYERWDEASMDDLMNKRLKGKEKQLAYRDILPPKVQSLRTFRLLHPIGHWIKK